MRHSLAWQCGAGAVGLLASLPAKTTIKFTGSADTAKPTLHVLAIGINYYTDRGWKPPGADCPQAFGPLSLAVKDATTLAAALAARAIGQDKLQYWLANRIKAKRAVILLDTCESGALIGGRLKARTDGSMAPGAVAASEAAVCRLHERQPAAPS